MEQVRIFNSSNENVKKYVFSGNRAVAEAVLYRYPTYAKRTVICCSTQSGCPVGCRFCGAGDAFVRSLTAEEIVEQPMRLIFDACAEESISSNEMERLQIMFMSMGEPMLNLKEVLSAIRTLNRLYPNAALLLSTSGPKVNYRPLFELAAEIDSIGLQFSIHESTDEARDQLIPFKAKCTLAEIATLGAEFWLRTSRQPFFNYCCHEKNSFVADAERLLSLFPPHIWQATLSVVCERDEHIAAANARQRNLTSRFQRLLFERGYSTRMFDPAGQDDIGGGCGQLWFVQDWMKKNPGLARPSVGSGKPKVHTPRPGLTILSVA